MISLPKICISNETLGIALEAYRNHSLRGRTTCRCFLMQVSVSCPPLCFVGNELLESTVNDKSNTPASTPYPHRFDFAFRSIRSQIPFEAKTNRVRDRRERRRKNPAKLRATLLIIFHQEFKQPKGKKVGEGVRKNISQRILKD